uniref:Fibrinogen C-terminal domain-containing protein n=1 Tax=Stomoxys calcitrans TaxID=35570 RepID=A0A1I8PZN8_STOCA
MTGSLEEQEATRKQLEEDLEINNRLNSLTKQQELFLADIESNDWKIILRRQDGSENFNRNWTDYKSGFGNPNGEFFIGLEVLHNLTNNGPPQELVVVMRNFGDEERHVKYDLFRVGNEAEKYALLDLGVFSGNLNFDALRSHRGAKFSTPDQKNNARNSTHCYNDMITSGWWYMDCGHWYAIYF